MKITTTLGSRHVISRAVAFAAIALIAALAGCGTAASSGPPATHAPAVPAAPATCRQQFDQWKAAHLTTISQFKDSLAPFESGTVTSAQAQGLSSAAQAMTGIPVPACGDPKGYYVQAMANLVTAGAAASGGGALSELGAMGPMENAATLLTELGTELQQAIGSSQI